MTNLTRKRVVESLRAAAGAISAPPQLKVLVRLLNKKHPTTSFALKPSGNVVWEVTSSFQPYAPVLHVRWWQKDDSGSFDISVTGRVVKYGVSKLPSAPELLKLIESHANQPIAEQVDEIPDRLVIKSVKVVPMTVDEWIGFRIDVRGNWSVKADASYRMAPEHKDLARKVFNEAMPQIKKQVAEWANKTAETWQDGSSLESDPRVQKYFPIIRGYDDIDQVDFDKDLISYTVSDR